MKRQGNVEPWRKKEERKEKEKGDDGNFRQIPSSEEDLWLKMWNAVFNMVSRGFGKQR